MTKAVSILSALMVSLSLVIWLFYAWLNANFGEVSAFQIFATLNFGLDQAPRVTESVFEIFTGVLLPSVLGGAITFLVLEKVVAVKGLKLQVPISVLTLLTLVLSVNQVSVAIDLDKYVTLGNPDSSLDVYASQYESATLARTPNLILIYVESLEDSFGSTDIYGENLLSELDEATYDFLSGTEVWMAPLAEWTMGALVASQCGFSVAAVIDTNGSLSHQARGNCLGSTLKRAGYKSVFLGGAPGEFFAKEQFIMESGYDRFYGLDQWLVTGYKREELNPWGLWDRDLFVEARKKLRALGDSDGPFNLTILTVDTHSPGHLDPRCESATNETIRQVIKCTTREVAEFINYARGLDFYDDTVIVIVGDHAYMGETAEEEIAGVNPTSIYFRIKPVASDKWLSLAPRGTLYDLGPTILQALSGDNRDLKLGLGLSMFSANTVNSVFEKYTLDPKKLTQLVMSDPYATQGSLR